MTHSNDMNRAKETFKLLHEHGEILLKSEIVAWAEQNDWKSEDADQLGSLAQQIGEGKKVVVQDGPWWKHGIVERWVADTGKV